MHASKSGYKNRDNAPSPCVLINLHRLRNCVKSSVDLRREKRGNSSDTEKKKTTLPVSF